MPSIILFDEASILSLYPFTLSRPAAEIRIGIFSIREKWERYTGQEVSCLSAFDYLQEKYPATIGNDNIFVRGNLLPTTELTKLILSLSVGEGIFKDSQLIAARAGKIELADLSKSLSNTRNYQDATLLESPWQIFQWNDAELRSDFELITKGRTTQLVSDTVQVIGKGELFIEEGAKLEACIINTSSGPVYIGKNAEVMEGCLVRGPFSLGEESTLKMGAKVYGATTIGPHCKVGGEVSNSVIFGYSNKAHDGFLGNSVLGEWCNLGADTNNSNLKNNYGNVKIWSKVQNDYIDTKLQFCGLFLGDHSKSAINTQFNTGTVVGFSSNIFQAGFPPKHIPSFGWGEKEKGYRLEDAIEVAARVMERRHIPFTETDRKIFEAISKM